MIRDRYLCLGLQLLGIVLAVGCLLACTPAQQTFRDAVVTEGAKAAAAEAAKNAVDSNMQYSGQCGNANCQRVYSWQGRVMQVQCPYCGHWNTINYSN